MLPMSEIAAPISTVPVKDSKRSRLIICGLLVRLRQEIAAEPNDFSTHPHRHVMERVLGWKLPVEVDLFTVPLHPGDTILLCSDGLWRRVRNSQMEDILSQTLPDSSQAAEALIQSVLDGGGKENVSVIVVSMAEAQNQTFVSSVPFFARPDHLHIPQD